MNLTQNQTQTSKNFYELDLAIARLIAAHQGVIDNRLHQWIRTSFRNSLLAGNANWERYVLTRPVISDVDYETLKYLTSLNAQSVSDYEGLHRYRLVNYEIAPDWLKTAFANKQPVYTISFTESMTAMLTSVNDYMLATYPNRKSWIMEANETYMQAKLWHAMLAKRKAVIKGETRLLEWPDGLPNPEGYHVFELIDQDAYKFNGSHMKHCVASYWGKRDSRILSLVKDRDLLLTIEVRGTDKEQRIVQMRGFKNSSPTIEQSRLMRDWSEAQGWTGVDEVAARGEAPEQVIRCEFIRDVQVSMNQQMQGIGFGGREIAYAGRLDTVVTIQCSMNAQQIQEAYRIMNGRLNPGEF